MTGSRGALRRVDEDRACDFGRGLGQPWGRVARVKLRGKVKSSEWWIFGVEWLLGAANGDRPKTRIQESKSNPMDGGACTLRLRLKLALNPDPSKSKGPAPRFFLSPRVFHPPPPADLSVKSPPKLQIMNTSINALKEAKKRTNSGEIGSHFALGKT